ncbi:MAG: NADH-quinone oxidoreductase subunit NuoE [Actinomycetota bacterium]
MAVLSEELRAKAGELIARYPEPRSSLLPILYLFQAEQGHLSREGMREAAELLGLTTAEVEAVATYYTMFKEHPTGTWVISVCTNVSCALAGARELYERVVQELGEEAREVTGDGLFTVEEVECLGACDAAPIVQVNYCNYDLVTQEQVVEMIDRIRRGDVPAPSRGPKPVSQARTARLLAGVGGSGGVARPDPPGGDRDGERTPRPDGDGDG